MGQPKQLLPYGGGTLVEHAAQVALDSGAAEVIVVLGAEAASIERQLQGINAKTILNERWIEGMGTSISVGVGAVDASSTAVIITLCDQPHITANHLKALTENLAQAAMAASSYNGVLGAPCAFRRELFAALMALRGDMGARELIRTADDVQEVPFTGASVDIDTPSDVANLIQ